MAPRPRFKLGMETFSYHLAFGAGRMDVPGFILRCAQLGLDGVQLNMGQLGPFIQADAGAVRQVRDMIAHRGMFLEIDTRGTDPAHLTEMLHLCKAIDADVLRTYASCGGDLAQELKQAPEHLRQVGPLCRELGVRLALENHEYETAEQIVNIVQAVDSEWVGTHVDTGNGMMVWEDPIETVRTLAPLAMSSHFKDHVVIMDDGTPRVVGVTLGTGSGQCEQCFAILAQHSPLERLQIEVCYAYSAPFRRSQQQGAGGQLGIGAFEVVPEPYDPAWIMPYPGRTFKQAEEQMLMWEDAAVVQSVAYVKSLNEQAGGSNDTA